MFRAPFWTDLTVWQNIWFTPVIFRAGTVSSEFRRKGPFVDLFGTERLAFSASVDEGRYAVETD
jgi:hypothetical protein